MYDSNGFKLILLSLFVVVVLNSNLQIFVRSQETNSNSNNNHPLNEDYHNLEQLIEQKYPEPQFDFGMPRNFTIRAGQTAMIKCRVDQLGDKSISWIRKRDLHILTAGILTYTSDERFQVIRTTDSRDWTLQVKYSQPRDSGIYECQINTEPKISMAFRLNVIVTSPDARATISGPSDLYIKVGSAITLTCTVSQPTAQPTTTTGADAGSKEGGEKKVSANDIGPIHWYRGSALISPLDLYSDGDNTLDFTRRISMESHLGDTMRSRLRIANAETLDSGNYTCLPTTAEGASVLVHVINDENPAAMQRGGAASKMYTENSTSLHIYFSFHIIFFIKYIIQLLPS